MPTGYTAAIIENPNLTFKEFALECARNFGALIMMRDDPSGTPIPEFEPSTFYKDKIEETEAEIERLENLSPEEIQALLDEELLKKDKELQDAIAKDDSERRAYLDMLVRVKKWTPPSSDHYGLKDFMISQIEESIKLDCDSDYSYYTKRYPPTKPEAFMADRLHSLKGDLEYYKSEWAKEIERTDKRNLWVKQLKESLT